MMMENRKDCGTMNASSPGAHCHLVWVMDVGTSVATVTLAKAVVIHAVLLLLLLLACVPDDGQASLDRTACLGRQTSGIY